MKGSFYVVGTGPGNPELLTLKAVRLLEKCPVWLAPKGKKDGESTALSIVEKIVSPIGKEILTHFFPMKKIRMGLEVDQDVAKAWHDAASLVIDRLTSGKDVVFPTLGDPAIYSTGFYVCETLINIDPEIHIEIVPGVSSIGASAAAAGQPLCLGDDRMVVVPATFENGYLKEILTSFDTIVLMKVHRVIDRIVPLLQELDLIKKAVLVERSSQKEEKVSRDLLGTTGNGHHYFSTIIVRKS